jgi:hypothetical protein
MIWMMAVDDYQVFEQGSLRWSLTKRILYVLQIGAVA